MLDLLKVLIPAVLALLGAMVAALLAHKRWKHEQQSVKADPFASARRDAYKALWERLEEVNLALREDSKSNTFLFESLKEVNTLFLQNSLYLDAEDQALMNRYVEALHRWRGAIFTSGNEDVASAFARTWMSIPTEVDADIEKSNREVADLRAMLLERVRKQMAE
jgi:RNase adaptor protein for sRNA GlmZ degradation